MGKTLRVAMIIGIASIACLAIAVVYYTSKNNSIIYQYNSSVHVQIQSSETFGEQGVSLNYTVRKDDILIARDFLSQYSGESFGNLNYDNKYIIIYAFIGDDIKFVIIIDVADSFVWSESFKRNANETQRAKAIYHFLKFHGLKKTYSKFEK